MKLDSFPYPFKGDVYRYSNNSVPLEEAGCVEVTSSYREEIKLKRALLSRHPKRCFQSLPHTWKGQWEITELVIQHLTQFYPEMFTLEIKEDAWTFRNHILNEKTTFIPGDDLSLSMEPLDFIGRHVQEDLIFMMERDGDLFLDAGQLCFPANWSLAFNTGMSFKEIHGPIPGFNGEGLDQRIFTFLMRMEAGDPWVRRNWSLMAGDRLDTSLETFDEWGEGRRNVTRENVGEFVHVRVEVQKLFRLPGSNGLLFTIHTHLSPLKEFTKNQNWTEEFYHILQELPDHIADYKGISLFKEEVIKYLKGKRERN
ncbi:DUF3445 domain-containing protein [Rossellomorea vietnamensis]|uniref:DUF3445 domain-containing protein n=1 Tax=Rossellomorea vietnamensis TaxID=218284 RepID=A0ACD4CBS6_9BACI|nr:DUF3445 domain-containing protein [Rossellomorea vietnamensis]UXH46055.1 DUF3445 domain-containing protein [Rossellomorea vietnamensis]